MGVLSFGRNSVGVFYSCSRQSSRSIWSIDRTISGATSPGQSGPGTNGNVCVGGVLCTLQSSKTGISPFYFFLLYLGHSLGWSLTPLQRCNRCILLSQLYGFMPFFLSLIIKSIITQYWFAKPPNWRAVEYADYLFCRGGKNLITKKEVSWVRH